MMDIPGPGGASEAIDSLLDGASRTAVAKQAMEIEFKPVATDIEVRKSNATRIPFGEVASLGAGLLSLSDAFQTISHAVDASSSGLLQAFDKAGNAIDTSSLFRFQDGSGMMGSRLDAFGNLEQIRFRQAGGGMAAVSYDPAMLLVAAALMEINQKLDAIQETQQEMFDYIKQRDKAELRGSLETLGDVLSGYNFNWDNETYKANKHIQVQSIRQQSDQGIIHHRAQIEGKLTSKGFLHTDGDVRQKMDALLDDLKEYRLALYLYAFSSFLEVMLLENFDAGYLESVLGKIDERSLAYRQAYSRCYDLLDDLAKTSLEARAVKGVSKAGRALGGVLARTPIGERTSIDEGLRRAGGLLAASKDLEIKSLMAQLHEVSAEGTRPFVDNLARVNQLYNQPTELLIDADAVYVLPISS